MKRTEYCSEVCMKRAGKRNQKHKRRIRKKNGFVAPVFKQEICTRDGWRCHICGKKINNRIKHPHPMSLTFDHIIPLAEGGTHEPKNVSIAHMICNSIKGGSAQIGGDQLRLF